MQPRIDLTLFTESPMNPLAIERARAEAGLAFEKHAFQFRSRHGNTRSIFEPLTDEAPGARRESQTSRSLVDALALQGLPEPAMHLAVLHDPRLRPGTPVDDIPQGTVRALVTDAATALHLAWSVRTLPPPEGEGPRNTLPLLAAILGRQLMPRPLFTIVPLDDEGARLRALQALGTHGFEHLYLIANPRPSALAAEDVRRLLRRLTVGDCLVDYAHFHALIRACDWTLTSHQRIPGALPLCLYSTRDMAPQIRALHEPYAGSERLVEVDRIRQLPMQEVATAHELGVSDVVPAAVLETGREISVAGSDVTRLDELLVHRQIETLILDWIPWIDTDVIRQMTWLRRLSARGVKLRDLAFLQPLRELRHLAIDRAPFAGLEELARLDQLESLEIAGMPLANADVLLELPRLRRLLVSPKQVPAEVRQTLEIDRGVVVDEVE